MTKAQQERHILKLIADIEIMRSILGALTVAILPDEAIDLLVEQLDIPTDSPIGATNAAADRMAEQISIFRARKAGR